MCGLQAARDSASRGCSTELGRHCRSVASRSMSFRYLPSSNWNQADCADVPSATSRPARWSLAMALGPTLKTAADENRRSPRRILQSEQGWKPDEYQILFHVSSTMGKNSAFSSSSRTSAACRIKRCGYECWTIWKRAREAGPDIGLFRRTLSPRLESSESRRMLIPIPPGYVDHRRTSSDSERD